MAENWNCPHCGTFTTLNQGDTTTSVATLNSRSKQGNIAAIVKSISCPNPACRELTIDWEVRARLGGAHSTAFGEVIDQKRLQPEAAVMPLPAYIPESIRKTYREACLVRSVSGAASAALSRRCLQGIVRDFFQIPQNKRGELGAELSHVKDRIDPQVWDDIQAVRSIGDIGAHMDKNVDVVVDVDPREAILLVGLIEELFKAWYIDRNRRREHSDQLRVLLDQKRSLQSEAKQASKKTVADATPPDLPEPEDSRD